MSIPKIEGLAFMHDKEDDSLGEAAAALLLSRLKSGDGDAGDRSGCGCATLLLIIIAGIVLYYFLKNSESPPISISTGIFYTVAGIISLLISVLLLNFFLKKSFSKKQTKKKYDQLSVVGIMIKKRLRKSFISGLFLISPIVISLISEYYYNIKIEPLIVFLSIVFLFLLIFKETLFIYRVRQGFLGSNRYEAIEIIKFILSESERIDFTDNDKSKKIISEEDLAKFQKKIKELQKGELGPAWRIATNE